MPSSIDDSVSVDGLARRPHAEGSGAAVGLPGLVTLDGESNWLEGLQLLALYAIFAVSLTLLPAAEALLPL